jgi:predicted lactoylglutathione lyase
MSFSVQVPEEDSAALVQGVREAGTETMTASPTWRQDSYWGWTVRDPAGNTVELYWMPSEVPEGDDPVWSGESG